MQMTVQYRQGKACLYGISVAIFAMVRLSATAVDNYDHWLSITTILAFNDN